MFSFSFIFVKFIDFIYVYKYVINANEENC